jgi:ubiquinone/menaquinone biosynthesis C-methylase UbiE
MIKSKGWNWKIVKDDPSIIWKNPSIESYYLLNRWASFEMKDFLDLGCGLGRHSVLFAKNGFNVSCFDISEEAINRTKQWCEEENLKCNYKVGDMLLLPYKDNSFDCILCRNVISHTDTEGIKKIIKELKRVLRKDGECYLTLGSKDTWGFKQESWPLQDPNTRLRMEEGPEYKTPHFYADYDLIKELFKEFKIVFINHIEDFYDEGDVTYSSFHYHVLIRKCLEK